ncbi:MAG: hypothetical protein C0168_09510 [Candidatus Aminicenantes bacterium]|nr:MAG: hypothetical protein C0168_09510 [Candidatus Aminicenantes bacterium]
MIHDAARPFFPAGRLKEALDNMGKMDVDGLAPALVSTDTLVEVDNGQIISFPDRHRIYHTQTPQIFIYEKIMSAYEKFRENLNDQPFTDDLSLAHSAGLRCGLIEGSQMNFKITTESDWVLAEQLLKSGGLDFT